MSKRMIDTRRSALKRTISLVALFAAIVMPGAAAADGEGFVPGVYAAIRYPGLPGDVLSYTLTNVGTASFGPALSRPGVRARPVLVDDGVGVLAGLFDPGQPRRDDGCETVSNSGEVTGAVALVTRGSCAFVTKVKNAQDAGAVAVIVIDIGNLDGPVGSMGATDPSPTILIPAMMVNLYLGAPLVVQDIVGVGLVDPSPPVIASTVTGSLGTNGWYTSDVHVSWSVTEPETPSTLWVNYGCVDQTITVDQTPQQYDCDAGSEAWLSTASVTVKRDATAPADAPAVTGTLGSNGWYTTDVSVAWNWSDALSGIDASDCDELSSSTAEGSGLAVSSSCRDLAGNAASDSRTFKIDKTPPTVTVTNVTDGGAYVLGSVPDARCSTTDGVSGVAQDASVTVTSGATVGSVTATCSGAADNAGNHASAVSATYSIAYAFGGFFSPVNNSPVLNVVKAGQAIPVKFSLGANQGLNIFAAGSPASQQVACDSSAPVDGIEDTVSASSSSLSYDATSARYSYVWKTDKSWAGTCRHLVLKLVDGTSNNANFMFR